MFLNHLAEHRLAMGLSLEDVAKKAAIDARVYAEMEAGLVLPTRSDS
jgi:predicted transcriptional regulator